MNTNAMGPVHCKTNDDICDGSLKCFRTEKLTRREALLEPILMASV
jgi:hypothetical protein